MYGRFVLVTGLQGIRFCDDDDPDDDDPALPKFLR